MKPIQADAIEPFCAALGRRLREARAARSWSIREAAGRLGCSPRFIHQLEQGKPTARIDKVLLAAKGLGLHISFAEAAPGAAPGPERSERLAARAEQKLREERLARAHERIAARLALGELAPSDIERARAQVRKWDEHGICSSWYVSRWTSLLAGPGARIASRLLALKPSDARALFQNTPFGFLVRDEMRG